MKKAKRSTKSGTTSGTESGDAIIINRAPVLELWAGCVAHFLYPSVSWATCLSVGGAISTITAISKGRSIGKIDKPGPGEAEKKRKERKEKEQKDGMDEIEVMSFNIKLDEDGQAIVGGKSKKGNEEALKKKFGPEQYEKARKAFEDVLGGWKGEEE